MICVGKLYNSPQPYLTTFNDSELAWISRYAWGQDYHGILRDGLELLARKLEAYAGVSFDRKICVDAAPLLERALARKAGLGWIGKNSCLIHEGMGSWFFLGEMLVSLPLEPGSPPPDRCGSCTRCIEACPTAAIVPTGDPQGPAYTVDSRLCISYHTIELRGTIPEEQRAGIGHHVFGCDICQDVCPWNSRAPVTGEPAFAPQYLAPPLENLAAIGEDEFRALFRNTPILRSRYTGFLRNVAVAMGNSGLAKFQPALDRLAASPDPIVAEHARWALERISRAVDKAPPAGRHCGTACQKTMNGAERSAG